MLGSGRAAEYQPLARSSLLTVAIKDHHDAGGAEIAEAGNIILPVGIDHGMGLGENFACLVMVDDDGFHAEFGRMGQGIMGQDTAIQGQQQLRSPAPSKASPRVRWGHSLRSGGPAYGRWHREPTARRNNWKMAAEETPSTS